MKGSAFVSTGASSEVCLWLVESSVKYGLRATALQTAAKSAEQPGSIPHLPTNPPLDPGP